MIIDKEYLEARKRDLQAQMARLQSDANAVMGGMQVIDAQLKYLEEVKDNGPENK